MKPFSIVTRGRRKRLLLPGVLDALTAEPLKATLLPLLSAGEPFIVDGREVERAATGPLQVLVAAARDLAATGREMMMSDPSPTLRSALAELGLSGELDKWVSANEKMRPHS